MLSLMKEKSSHLLSNVDEKTKDHLHRVSLYSKMMAETLKPSGSDRWYADTLAEMALLHDIGENGIPRWLAMIPRRLTAEEFEIMKTHTLAGFEMLGEEMKKAAPSERKKLEMGRQIARSHHERWDGKGYPDGLKGGQIPLCARIVGVAEVFDALTTQKPYRKSFSSETAFEMIVGGAGTQFDPEVIEAFVKCPSIYKGERKED